MALLGFQLVSTLIAASILSKIISFYSFTRLLTDGLIRYLTPSDQQLLEATGACKLKKKKRRTEPSNPGTNTNYSSEVFYFPRSVFIKLSKAHVSNSDIVILPLYPNYQWLVDFSVCSMCVYFFNEFASNYTKLYDINNSHHSTAQPSTKHQFHLTKFLPLNARINLSLVWVALSLWFSLRTLISLAAIYFRTAGENIKSDPLPMKANVPRVRMATPTSPAGEILLILGAGFIFLIAAVLFLAFDGRLVDFELQAAYENLTFPKVGSFDHPLLNRGVFHAILAFSASAIGALFVYPGIKFGMVYQSAVLQASLSPSKRFLLHLTFISPLVPILLWITPVTEQLSNSLFKWSRSSTVIDKPLLLIIANMASRLFTNHLNSIRLLACLWVVLLRLMTSRCFLQAYLNSAQSKLDRFSREPGRTSNKEIQRLVASIFHCLNLVVLQYIAPTVFILCLICLYKSTSGLSWFSSTDSSMPLNARTSHLSLDHGTQSDQSLPFSWVSSLLLARFAFNNVMDILEIHGMIVARGIMSFLLWWTLVCWQTISLCGLVYQRFSID